MKYKETLKDTLKDNEGNIVKCECGGEFEFMGQALLTDPPRYPYICNKCGKQKVKIVNETIYIYDR